MRLMDHKCRANFEVVDSVTRNLRLGRGVSLPGYATSRKGDRLNNQIKDKRQYIFSSYLTLRCFNLKLIDCYNFLVF